LVENRSRAVSRRLTGVYRIAATGIIIKGWYQRIHQPHAARNAGREKAAMPLAPPRRAGRTSAPAYPPWWQLAPHVFFYVSVFFAFMFDSSNFVW